MHRNSALAIAAQMSGVRQIQGARKNKNAIRRSKSRF
jgi:hypothetical protein